MDRLELIKKIYNNHDSYLDSLGDATKKIVAEKRAQNRYGLADDLILHVIEELVELRRTYPHKFWKQSAEGESHNALLEEASDVFLMFRSLYLEICHITEKTEEDFLSVVLKKAKKNKRRFNDGY